MSEKLRFGEILVRAGVLERAQVEQITANLAETDDLGEALVRRGLIDESRMLQAVGQALNLPTVVLTDLNPDERALKLLPQALCEQHRVFPVELEQTAGAEHLHVAMANPSDIRGIKQITRKARRRIRPLVASARDIADAIAVHYGGATRHRADGNVEQSPVDMFDFSVTDLSSMETPGDGAVDLGGLGPAPALPSAKRDALASLDDLSAFGAPASASPASAVASTLAATPGSQRQSSAPPAGRSRTPSLPPRSPLQSRPPAVARPHASQPNMPPPSPSPRARVALDFGSLPPGNTGEMQDDVFDLGSMESISALGSEPERLAALERSSRSPERAASKPVNAGPMRSLPPQLAPSTPLDAGPMRSLPPRAAQSSPLPPRLPPTSMPPRPGDAGPAAHPGEAGFGMIRRKKRRNERALQISQAPAQSETGVLDRIDNESLRSGDRVIARYLDRFQKAPTRPGADELLGALERALRKAGSPTAQLVLILVRQLVQQGVVDAEALIDDLLET